MFFFEKKNQKTFVFWPWPRIVVGHGRRIKVFCFFSSEKKTFLPSFLVCLE